MGVVFIMLGYLEVELFLTVLQIQEVMNIVNEIIENDLCVTVKYVAQNKIGTLHGDFSAFDVSQVICDFTDQIKSDTVV